MAFKKILLCLVMGLVVFAGSAFAAETPVDNGDFSVQETTFVEWEWPEAGLSFEYPSNWQVTQQGQFKFILFNPDGASETVAEYFGLQTGFLSDEETLQAVMEEFATQFGGEITETTFGGVTAYRMDVPAGENGERTVFFGFSPAEGEIALFNYQTSEANLEAFQPIADHLLETAQVSFLELDHADLNTQLQESFAANQTLTLGNADAPLTVVEVFDFSCPHCVNYNTSIERLINDKVLTGEARLEFVLVTFIGHEASDMATQAMYCAVEQGAGWDMHSLLIDGYKLESTAFYNVDSIMGAVESSDLEVNADVLRSCIESAPYDGLITSNTERASGYDATSTPSILFATGDGTPAFMTDPASGEPQRGGVPLLLVYNHMNELLAE